MNGGGANGSLGDDDLVTFPLLSQANNYDIVSWFLPSKLAGDAYRTLWVV